MPQDSALAALSFWPSSPPSVQISPGHPRADAESWQTIAPLGKRVRHHVVLCKMQKPKGSEQTIEIRTYAVTSLNAIYSVEIPPTPLDKGGGASRGDPPKALTPTKCVSPKMPFERPHVDETNPQEFRTQSMEDPESYKLQNYALGFLYNRFAHAKSA